MVWEALVRHGFAKRGRRLLVASIGSKLGEFAWGIAKVEKSCRVNISAFVIPVVRQDIRLVVRVNPVFVEYLIVHQYLLVIKEHPAEPIASRPSKA